MNRVRTSYMRDRMFAAGASAARVGLIRWSIADRRIVRGHPIPALLVSLPNFAFGPLRLYC